MKLGEAFIEILAEDKSGPVLAGAEAKTKGLIGNISGSLLTLGTGAVLAGATAAAGAVTAIGVAAFNVASDVREASNNMQAELGLTADEAARLGDVAQAVWANNFGASIQDAAGVVSQVRQQLGALADDELQRAAENALRLSDVFGTDTAESLNAVKALMENFGLTSQQAFDFITTGMQNGLNSSGDFLDSVGEYSNVFASSGFAADQMFSIMESGLQAGVLGTDKISDAFKEFGIRVNEGGDEVAAAFELIGYNFEEIQAEVAAGDATWADYAQNIVYRLEEIDDPLKRNTAQVALFGTQAEDLGVKFTSSLEMATTSLQDMEGATDTLDAKYQNLGDAMEGFKRQALDAIAPLGEALMELVNSAMPLVESAFGWFETTLVPMISTAAEAVGTFIDTFIGGLESGLSPVEAFKTALADFIPPEVMAAVEFFIDLIANVLGQALENAQGYIQAFGQLLTGDFQGALDTLATMFENTIEMIGETFGRLWEIIQPVLAELWANLVNWLQTTDFAQLGTDMATMILEGLGEFLQWLGPMLVEWAQAFWDWVQSVDWAQLGTDIITFIVDALSAFGEFVWAVLETWGQAFFDWVESVDWQQIGTDIIEAIKDGLAQFWELVSGTVSGWWDDIKSAVTGFDWAQLGTDIINGLVGGIEAAKQAIFDTVTSVAEGVAGVIKAILGIGSPSKVFMQIGADLMSGLAIGIRNTAGEPVAAVGDAAQQVQMTAVAQMAQTMTALVAAIAPAILALRQFESFDVPRSVLDRVEEFGFQIHWLVRVIAYMGYQLGSAVGLANEMSAAIEKVVDAVVAGIRGLQFLAQEPIPTDLNEKYQALANELGLLVGVFSETANLVGVEFVRYVGQFADAAQQVLGLIKPGLEAMTELSRADFVEIVGGWHLAEQIDVFKRIIDTLVRKFLEAALMLSSDLAASIEDFAGAAEAVLGLVVDGIEAAKALSETDFGTIVGGWHLAEQIVIFRNITRTVVREFAEAARQLAADLTDQVVAFADAAASVFGLVNDGLAAAKALAEIDFGPIVQGTRLADQIKIFRNIIRTLVRLFAEAAQEVAGELLAQARQFAEAAGAIIGIVQPGIDAIRALGEYVSAQGLMEATQQFGADLFNVANELVFWLRYAATLIGADALAAAAEFAAALRNLMADVNDALQSLSAMATAERPDVQEIMVYLLNQAQAIARALTGANVTLNGSVVDAAWAFARAVEEVVAAVQEALQHLSALVNSNVPGSLQGILNEMVHILSTRMAAAWATINGIVSSGGAQMVATARSVAQQVVQAFALDWAGVGARIASGIASGISRGTGAISAAASRAAAAALASAQRSLGIASPSKRAAEEIGLPFVEGIASGIRQAGAVTAAVEQLVNVTMPQMVPAAAGAGGPLTIHIRGRVEDETFVIEPQSGQILRSARARGLR